MSDDLQAAQDTFGPKRGQMTVQIYDLDQPTFAKEQDPRGIDLEFRRLSRSALPIRYVDRETLERMR